MNHTYRLVWSKSLGMLVAVCEHARARGKDAGGKAMRIAGEALASGIGGPFRLTKLALLAAAAFGQAAFAHTTSVGYELLNGNTVEIWYGTYHGSTFTEGSLSFVGDNGYSQVVSFSDISHIKPLGLVDGTTNFYSGGSTTTLVGTPLYSITAWQGAQFTNLGAGTYTFTYIPLVNPTADWAPINEAIRSSSFTITAEALAAAAQGSNTRIDTSQASFSASTLAGSPVFSGGTLLVDGSQTLAQNFSIEAPGGTIDQNGNHASLSGVIADAAGGVPGSLAISNSGQGGSVTLSGINTYTGATVVNSGAALALAGDGSIAASSGLLNNGSFDISGTNSGASVATLAGNGSVLLGGKNLTLTAAEDTFSGTISGTGGVIVAGGAQTLSGNNSYTGGTTVSGARLTVGADASLGDAAGALTLNDGTLHTTGSFSSARDVSLSGSGNFNTDAATTVTSSGTVSGSGGLVKSGDGTLALSGVVSHAGGTVVNGGTLILSGNNTYTGGNVVNGGILKVASDASLGDASNSVTLNGGTLQTTTSFTTSRALTMNGDSHINADAGTVLTADGTVNGSGRLYKDGGGTLVLGGDNIGWSGGTTINAGLVKVTSSTGIGTGDVVLNGGTIQTTATLTTGQRISLGGNTQIHTDAGTTTTLTGDIQDSGASADGSCFIKSGAGTLNLKGTTTLSLGTCVQEGTLRANGVLNSVVTVDAQGTLRGAGLITGPMTVQGRLAPGNSPGTLTATATVTMTAAGTFQADINGLGTASGPGNYSRLLVTGAGSQFIAGGATLAPNLTGITGTDTYTPYVPAIGDTFRIISAEGGIVGRFAPLAQPDGLAAGTRMAVFYDVLGSNSIDLRVLPSSYAAYLGAAGGTRNVQSAGAALDRLIDADQVGTATSAGTELAYIASGLRAAQLPDGMRSLSGEVHGALAAVAPLSGQALQATVSRQLRGAASAAVPGAAAEQVAPAKERALWVDLAGNRGKWSADGAASGFTANRTQLTIGGDLLRAPATRVGAGISHAEANVSAAAGSGSVDDNMAFVYGEHAIGEVVVDGLAGFGHSNWDSQRADPLGIAGALQGSAGGHNALLSAGVRTRWNVNGTVLEPFAKAMWQRAARGAYNEGTATPAALALGDYAEKGSRVLLGVSGNSKVNDPLAAAYTYQYSAAVGNDNGSLVRPAVAATLAGAGMTIAAPQVGHAFVQANAGGTARIGRQAYAYYGLSGEFRSGKTDLGLSGGVRVSF